MANIKLDVIPEPKKGTATILSGIQILIKGQGDTNYVCGTCGSVICEKINRGQVINIVFKCFKCGSYNLIKGT